MVFVLLLSRSIVLCLVGRDEVPIPGVGVVRGVPRFYEEIFKCSDALSLEEIKRVRVKFMEAHGDDYTPERLMDKYKCKKAQVNLLTRSI